MRSLGIICSALMLLNFCGPVVAESENVTVVKRPKVALALGGGGTRGAAHVGVLRVLQREHIPIDYIAGTSMGAIVGGLYCAGMPPDKIQSALLDKGMLHSYLTVPIAVRVAVIPLFIIPHFFGYRPYDGLYKGNKFRKHLDSTVPVNRTIIEELPIPFAAVCSNLVDGSGYAITKGDLGEALQASAAIPFLRRPVAYGEALLVDGALEANLPVPQARQMGGDVVIAVNVSEDVHKADPSHNFRHILTVPHRVVSMVLAKLDDYAGKEADIVVHPDVTGIHLLSEKPADALKAIQAGERAAEAALPEIKARLAQAGINLDKPQGTAQETVRNLSNN